MGFSLDPDRKAPRQLGAVFGLYDKPLYRDWLGLWTAFWIVVAVLSVVFPVEDAPPTTDMPMWLNAMLSALVIGFILGFLPAYVRLLLRRRRLRRERGGASAKASTPDSDQVDEVVPQPSTGSPASPPPENRAPVADSTAVRTSPKVERREAARPAPIDALDMATLRDSEALSEARLVMPYPVARAVRAVQHAGDMKDAYEAVLRGSETLTVVMGATATAWARHYGVLTVQLTDLQEAYVRGGVSQGHWQQALASIAAPMASSPHPLPGLVDSLKRGKGGTGLLADLQEMVEERNRWAHGSAPRTNLEAAERLEVVLPKFLDALERARFLADIPWVLTTDVKLRRREGDFQIQASRAMGDHPDFDYFVFSSGQPLAEGIFYLRAPDASIDLTPLVVMRPCPTCHQPEVAYADKVDERRRVVLKTFDRGHILFDQGLEVEVRELFQDSEGESQLGAG
jgi:hypothetical protein